MPTKLKITTIIADQFSRLRAGGRYFTLNESWDADELRLFRRGDTLAGIIAANAGIANLQADVFKFTASCKAPKACAKIKLDRDGGDHSHYRSTLTKTAAGVYKGTEGPFPYKCPGSPSATFRSARCSSAQIVAAAQSWRPAG